MLKSLKGSEISTTVDIEQFISQTSSPMEAKGGGLEIMTIPAFKNNPENFSGDEDSYTVPKGSPSQLSGEDGKDEEGSGGKELAFILHSQMKETEPSSDHSAPLETTVGWQLQTTQATAESSSSEPEHEEAKGEILYVHRPIEKPKHNQINVPLVKRKQSVILTDAPQIHTSTPSPITAAVVSGQDELENASTTPSGDVTTTEGVLCTPDPAVSSTWLPVVLEEEGSPQTPVPTLTVTESESELKMTHSTVQPTSPGTTDPSHQAESRSGVSESFVLANSWRTSEQSPTDEPLSEISPEKDTANETEAAEETSTSKTSGTPDLHITFLFFLLSFFLLTFLYSF